MNNQQGDVLLFQSLDDGEIEVEDGVVRMTGGLSTAAYISLFGGNEDDDGSQNTKRQYWGNHLETSKARTIRSETQNLLYEIPATSSNLRRLEDAAKRDLQWMIDEGVASSVEVEASIPALNKVELVLRVNAEGEESAFAFVENWKNTV